LALAPALLLAPAVAGARTERVVVKKAPNAKVGEVILTTRAGRSLYSLSVETHGRFICKGGCLATWHPLLVGREVKPKGPAVRLGTMRRPDGRRQVTFRGLPLYSFSGDTGKGDVNGEGFKDVGTWHVAGVSALPASQPQPEAPAPTPSPSPYPY
jgi:predicted lipoprotein with Yx(FWY)xxD motif